MAGTGGIHFARSLVEFWYDGSSAEADVPVTVTAVNSDTGDVGQKKDKNDGLVSFSYPDGFEGEDTITVRDDAGVVIAEFETGRFKVGTSATGGGVTDGDDDDGEGDNDE